MPCSRAFSLTADHSGSATVRHRRSNLPSPTVEGELRRGRQLGQARAPVALRLFNLATVSPVPDDEIPERQADAGEVGPGVLVEFGQFGENGAHAHAVYHSVVEANTDNSTAAINCRESFKAGRFR